MTRPDARTLWLTVPAALALAPHMLYVPPWASLAVALVLAWRLSPLWRKDSPTQRLLRLLLAGAGIVATYLRFHSLAGPEPGITLLVLMVALKLLESEGRRDHMVIALAGYFLLLATLIHHQELAVAAWLLIGTVALTAALAANQAAAPPAPIATLTYGGTLVAQALPFAILLFLLFPRLPSPMSGLVHLDTGRTGLSDSMAPGSVSRLIRSDAVAFRVDFTAPDTDARGLYWRGPVLTDYDGRTWRRGDAESATLSVTPEGKPVDYTVTLEASEQPWLPVAGLSARAPLPGARLSADLEWWLTPPERERRRYPISAWLNYRLEPELAERRRSRALALPPEDNPETVALAQTWAERANSAEEIVALALNHFRREPFHYTLAPPPLGEQAVDEFLFRTRRGFCEHYAGAFTVLMRAAGVPARVVTGYQGGERNPVGGYWIVRERDAHAWAEVWLAGRGWTRIDPTAAVAPERVELGIDAALPAAERPLLDLPPDWLRPIRQGWDFVNNGWNQWVLGYDFERQRRLLSTLSPSLASLKGMLWAMLAGTGLLLAGLALALFRPERARPRNEVDRLYALFLRRLGRVGLVRAAAEGPRDFAARVARHRADLAGPVDHVTRLYVALRYGGETDQLADFRRGVRRFRPGRPRANRH